jgi:hypothetical protein
VNPLRLQGSAVAHLSDGPRKPVSRRLSFHDRGDRIVELGCLAGQVIVSTYEQFCEGRPVFIESRPTPDRVEAVVEAAVSWLGTAYDLFSFNCESFANLVHDGTAASPQVARGILVTAAVGTVGLLSLLGSRGDEPPRDRNGRFTKR